MADPQGPETPQAIAPEADAPLPTPEAGPATPAVAEGEEGQELAAETPELAAETPAGEEVAETADEVRSQSEVALAWRTRIPPVDRNQLRYHVGARA